MVDQGIIEHLNTWYVEKLQRTYGKAEIHIDYADSDEDAFSYELWVKYNGKGHSIHGYYNLPTVGVLMKTIAKWFRWHGVRQCQ